MDMGGKSNIPADVQKEIAAQYAAGKRSGELSAQFGVNLVIREAV
jgi:hypothetical protein